jgi:hypothetical protein
MLRAGGPIRAVIGVVVALIVVAVAAVVVALFISLLGKIPFIYRFGLAATHPASSSWLMGRWIKFCWFSFFLARRKSMVASRPLMLSVVSMRVCKISFLLMMISSW